MRQDKDGVDINEGICWMRTDETAYLNTKLPAIHSGNKCYGCNKPFVHEPLSHPNYQGWMIYCPTCDVYMVYDSV